MQANELRGEASLRVGGATVVLRPTFQALVAAEAELGPLFALAGRAADGRVTLAETVALFWHCLAAPPAGLTREGLGEAVAAMGLAAAAVPLGAVLRQIVSGR